MALYGKMNYLTLEHLRLDWTKLSSSLGLNEQEIQWSGSDLKTLQRGVLVAALQNFWTDVRLLVLELLLSWADQDNSESLDDSLAMEIATGMLNGRQWRGGGTISEPLSGLDAAAFLSANVRQCATDGEWQGGYVGLLSRFVERIKDMQLPEMVSSRVYSFGGADDAASLQEQQLLLLAVFSASDWTTEKSLRRQVDIWMSSQYKSVEILRQKVKDWLHRLDDVKELSPKVLSILLERTGKPQDGAKGRARAKQGIESLRDFVEATRERVLAGEPVAPERLEQLARFASSKRFQSESGKFPLQLFAIKFGSGEMQDFTLTMQQVRKGELTRTEMDQRAVDDEEFWAETMARQVGALLLNDILGDCEIHDIYVPNVEAYWLAVKAEAAKVVAKGEHPILILDNPTRPDWVWQWRHADAQLDYTRPVDLRVQRFAGRGNGYICNFNEIEVYVAPLPPGQSILLAREAFRTVTFKAFEEGRVVDVSYLKREDSKLLVDLKLKVSRQVEFADVEAVRLFYSAGPDSNRSNDNGGARSGR